MPTPVGVARQCLTPEAGQSLDEAVSVAKRRGHAQTTSLHAVSALLSLPSSSILRDACCRARNSAYSPRLQFKALDLCLSVSLDRAPSSHNNLSSDHEPPVSNSLMAAIKRSQANQRRHPDNFHFYHQHQHQLQNQQTFSVSTVKVELQHLILSILDDPVVSRVFAEAGFRSSEIKLAILRPLPHLFRSGGPPIFLCNLPDQPRRGAGFGFGSGFPFLNGFGDSDDNFRRIGEILVRSKGRNPLLLGTCANDPLRSFVEAVEKRREGVLPMELAGLRVVCIGKELESGDGEVLGLRLREIGVMAEECVGPGVVVSFGDLKVFLNDDGFGEGVVMELAKLLKVHCDKFWLVGSADSYESYLKFLGRFSSVEKDWDLQILPITSVKPSESYHQRPKSSLMDSFVPFGGFFSSQSDLKGPQNGSFCCVPQCQQCGEKCEHELLAASKERFSISAPDPYPSNLPQWLKTTEFGKAKALDVKTKDDGVLLDSSKSVTLQNNSDNICQLLHQRTTDPNTCQTVVGFHCTDNKNDCADKSPSEYINLNSRVPIGVQTISPSQPSSPFPALFTAKQEKNTPKLTEMFRKVKDLESGDQISCNMSSSSLCNESQLSPTSVTSVTTDLGLGICSSPTSNKLKKPEVQYTMEPPKETRNQFSSSFNLDEGNIRKHPSQSSSCLSFDYCGQVDARNPKIIFEALSKEVSWQDEALRAIIKTIFCGPTKRVNDHGANQRGDKWMNFVGPDRHGKKKIAVSLAELLYGSREKFTSVDLSSEEMNGCVKFRGKTNLDFIVDECCKKPLSVVFIENVDRADIVAQSSLSQAMKTGKIADSHGREVSVNNAIFVFSFSGYQNTLIQTREPSYYSEERILRAKGGGIKIKVEYAVRDIRNQSIRVANNSIDVIPNLIFINKRKLICDNELHDHHLLSDTAKRAHTMSNRLLDLNLPAEENEQKQTEDGNSDHFSSENQNLWLQDLYNQVDETVVFKPYDFDALADRVLKLVKSNFNKIIGSECALQIQTEVMDQLLAAAYVADRDMEVENWVEQVLCGGFNEVQRRYNLTGSSIVKLATCSEQAASVHLPPRIILD